MWLARGFLSAEEAAQIEADAATRFGGSETVGVGAARESETAWLPAADSAAAAALAERAQRLAGEDDGFVAAAEHVQVVRYGPGGLFDLHHESTAFLRRFATVLVYLSDAPADGSGATAFPLADAGVAPGNVSHALEMAHAAGGGASTCAAGLRVPPKAGDAVLFYNYGVDGRPDPLAVHAACRVGPGAAKLVANQWLNFVITD